MKVYERKNNSGTATFYLHYSIEGQFVRERLAGIHDRGTAQLAANKRSLEIARGQVGLPMRENLSLGAAMRVFVASKEMNCTQEHFNHIAHHAEEIVGCLGKDTPVKMLRDTDVNRLRKILKQLDNGPSTINRKTGLLKGALDYAVKQGHIGTNPLAGIQRLSDPTPDVWRFLTEEEITALLDVLRDGKDHEVKRSNGRNYIIKAGKDDQLLALIIVLLNTGARLGEALSLRWRDVNMKQGIVSLTTSKFAALGRKAKARHIPMNRALRELLEGLPHDGERVLSISEYNLRRKFDRACDLAGIGHCRLHYLRHTFASHLVASGVPLTTVQKLLGHSTLTMTMRYSHLAPGAESLAVENLNFGARETRAKVVEMSDQRLVGNGR